ncbi:MAG: DUF2066 domain-containing protein [Gammaproteobacteria bacterium]|nr:DUF2066 domain-containing protein [Gammaproteobacteria bacterium]
MAYQKTGNHSGSAPTKRLKLLLLAFSMLGLAPIPVSAIVVENLFEVDMPVLDENRAIRDAALDDGLVEVLIRISGDSEILKKIKAPSASSYVQQFEYSTQTDAQNQAAVSKRLWARYNATKVLDFLRQQAVPIWGEHRSQVVIWLAVRDGGQRYILRANDTSPIKAQAEEAFKRRGIPVIWPENDAADQDIVRFADVWAGFAEPVKKASQRYSSGPAISVSISWDGQLWTGQWSLIAGDEIKRWRLSGADYVSLIARAMDLSADVLGQKYATLQAVDGSQYQQITVEISQVSNVESFRRAEKYLSSLSAVQAVQLAQVEADRVTFDLSIRTKVDDLLKLIQSGSTMEIVEEKSNAEQVINALQEKVATETATVTDNAIPPTVTANRSYRFILR